MNIFFVTYFLFTLFFAVLASPIVSKPPPSKASHPASSVTPTATSPSTMSQPDSKSVEKGKDIFDPIKLTNETLPLLGIDDEAKPQKPHGQCVIA
ncbi:hypothetical protein B0H13DRAFT_2328938 [Mycena leptocephala]|nr:hypothetical protein B0H13DRAFT_2328938 [Mycena leptocephala]